MQNISALDLNAIRYAGHATFSPDGQTIVYVRTVPDYEQDAYRAQLVAVDVASGQERLLTSGDVDGKPVKDGDPQFAPDGKRVAFRSNREGKQQLFLLDVASGAVRKLTNFQDGVKEFVWAPDGQSLVAVARPDTEVKSDVIVTDRLRYRGDGEGYYGAEYLHLWQVSTDGEVKMLTEGDFDHKEPNVSPDGKTVLFTSWRGADEVEVLPSLYELDVVSGEVRELVQAKGRLHAPTFSPDGSQVAFYAHEKGEGSGHNLHLYVLAYSSGEVTNLTGHWDRSVTNTVMSDTRFDGENRLIWSADGSQVYFLATEEANAFVYRVDVASKRMEKVNVEATGSVTSFDLQAGNIAYVMEQATRIGEVFVLADGEVRTISRNNDAFFAERHVVEPERFVIDTTDGLQVEGWILKPPHFQAGEKYPLVLQIHGGPHFNYGSAFFHEYQLLAAEGYVVVFSNPRGSTGYGEAFVEANIGDWGGKDYEDLMQVVDFAETLPYVDTEQKFVIGGSYGGYMTNWITTQNDRFKAAVTLRCISNFYSMMGTSDIGFWFNSIELGGVDLWEQEDFIMDRSPIRHVRNVKAPTLIMHSEEDYRCPMEQSEQWFTALKRLGVETKFVRFPDESHGLSRTGKPQHRVERLGYIVEWFNQYREVKVESK